VQLDRCFGHLDQHGEPIHDQRALDLAQSAARLQDGM
jgi:hypothetical protein